MKTLFLKEMHVENFQKFKRETFEFGQTTNIYGPNRAGKTTIYSAMTWLLFGKDSQGRTDTGRGAFDIKRLENKEKVDHEDVSVLGVFFIDDKHFQLKRVLHEKWTKGKEATYTGDETLCYIDDVPKKITEYQAFINDIMSEDEFRMITDINYFLSLSTAYQRNYLCVMGGVRPIEDICESNTVWKTFLNELSGKSLEDALKQYSYEKKELEKKLRDLDPAIRALEDNKPQPLNWDELSSEKTMLESLMEDVNASINDSGKLDESKQKEINLIRTSISDKRKEFYNVTNKIEEEKQRVKRAFEDEAYSKGEDKRKHQLKLRELYSEKSALESAIKELSSKAERLSEEKKALFEEYKKEQEQTFKNDQSGTMCPLLANHVCNSLELIAHMDKNRELAESTFNRKKEERISQIIKNGKAKAKEEDECKEKIEEKNKMVSSIDRQIEAETTIVESMPDYIPERDKPIASPEITSLSQTRISLNAEISALEEELKAKETEEKPDNSELTAKKMELKRKHEDVIGKLSVRKQIEDTDKSILEYKDRANKIASSLSELNNKEFLAKEINRASVEEATERVNKLFAITTWQMFELQKNGLYAEVCKPSIEGVSQSLNTEAMINVGIDIANTISRFKGVSAPLFIDNHESVNETIPTVGQSINLFVAPQGTELTIKIKN
ncbi:MAG: AAA family ATPase [Bacilli bacterium]